MQGPFSPLFTVYVPDSEIHENEDRLQLFSSTLEKVAEENGGGRLDPRTQAFLKVGLLRPGNRHRKSASGHGLPSSRTKTPAVRE